MEKFMCPSCKQIIKETDNVGISQIRTVFHLTCGSQPEPPEVIIEQGVYEVMFRKYLT